MKSLLTRHAAGADDEDDGGSQFQENCQELSSLVIAKLDSLD
jgi:hypothetical protein